MTHVMLDLETWGIRPGCAIRSIGAIVFDPVAGTLGDTFYQNVSDASCVRVGLTADIATEAWWAKEENRAADALLRVNQRPLPKVVSDFFTWLDGFSGADPSKIFLWARDPDFDATILRAACEAVGFHEMAWDFRNHRSVRTAPALANYTPTYWSGTYHNALDDARNQALHVFRAYEKLDLLGEGVELCPICLEAMVDGQARAFDITEGECHAECLKGSDPVKEIEDASL